MNSFFNSPARPHWKLATAGVAVLAAAAVALFLARPLLHPQNPLVSTPALALEALPPGALFFNAAARPWLLTQRPELLTAEDRQESSGRARQMAQAVQSPKLFRQMDRQTRFDSVLLVGDPSQNRPLLEHLLDSQDWTLAYLDHTSLIYRRRGGAVWTADQLGAVRARLVGASRPEQASFLAQAAGKLVAVRQSVAAKAMLEEAQTLGPKLPEVWSATAQYRMARGEWTEALASANRALALDGQSPAALASKTQALYSTKRFAEAYEFSRRLIALRGEDPGLLFYHAKICHEAKAFGEEIQSMEKLISLAEASGRPTSGYRIYLAQAYAADCQAEPALAQFRRALADPELPPEQRKFAQETMTLVKGRAGL